MNDRLFQSLKRTFEKDEKLHHAEHNSVKYIKQTGAYISLYHDRHFEKLFISNDVRVRRNLDLII
jgi:hypothetical protein